jgi:hypothetical protein
MILKITTPSRGKPTSLREFIIEIAMDVKMYDISLRLKFLVLNLRIAKMAISPTAIPNSIKTDLSIELMKKTVIPIRKKVNTNFSFFEYLKYTTRMSSDRKIRLIKNLIRIPQKSGLFRLKKLSGMVLAFRFIFATVC